MHIIPKIAQARFAEHRISLKAKIDMEFQPMAAISRNANLWHTLLRPLIAESMGGKAGHFIDMVPT